MRDAANLCVSLSRTLNLVLQVALSELRAEVARTHMGFLWWFLDPLLYSAVYYVAFGYFVARDGPANYHAFLITGVFAWRWFQNGVIVGIWSLRANAALVRQAPLPIHAFPCSGVLASLIKYMATIGLVLVILWSKGYVPNWSYIHLPAVILAEALLLLGTTLVLAGVVGFIADVRNLVSSALHLAFFFSGVLFSVDRLPTPYQWLFRLNPMVAIIEAQRCVLLDGHAPATAGLAYAAACGGILTLVGLWFLRCYGRVLPKYL